MEIGASRLTPQTPQLIFQSAVMRLQCRPTHRFYNSVSSIHAPTAYTLRRRLSRAELSWPARGCRARPGGARRGPAGRLSPSAQHGFADLLINTDTQHGETGWILSTDHSINEVSVALAVRQYRCHAWGEPKCLSSIFPMQTT